MNLLRHNLKKAKNNPKDEFYTKRADVERAVEEFRSGLEGKVVYCNCDDYRLSYFYKVLKEQFKGLGLKGLHATNKDIGNGAFHAYFDGVQENVAQIEYGGFESEEVEEILLESDVVFTNPPFSLFKELVRLLDKSEKDFILLGHQNAITYVDLFPKIKDNRVKLGWLFKGGVGFFESPYNNLSKNKVIEDGDVRVSGLLWYSTIQGISVPDRYSFNPDKKESDFDRYDNYFGIDIPKSSDFPEDYYGEAGVPVTFLQHLNPEQFEILGSNRGVNQCSEGYFGRSSYINGKEIYKRVFVRRIK